MSAKIIDFQAYRMTKLIRECNKILDDGDFEHISVDDTEIVPETPEQRKRLIAALEACFSD